MKKIKETDYPVGKMLKRVFSNIKANDRGIFSSCVFYTLTAGLLPFFAVLLPKFLIDELMMPEPSIQQLLIILGIFFAVSGLFGYISTYMHEHYYARLSALRIDYIRQEFKKLVGMDYKYVEDAAFSERNTKALEACSSNSNGIEGISHKLYETPAIILTAAVYMVIVGILNPIVLAGLVLNAAASVFISVKAHQYSYSKKDDLAHRTRRKDYYYKTTYDFTFGKDIRLYDLKNRIRENYLGEIKNYLSIRRMVENRKFALSFIGLITLLISDGLTYGILVIKVLDGMSIADFTMYIGMIVGLTGLITKIADNISFIKNEGQYVHEFYKFLDTDLGEKGGDLPAITNDTLEIEFKNVYFKYPGTEKYIFEDLSMKINKGERLAVVGINGAGKSTLVKLITGLFDVTSGEILINGTPIKQFDKQALFSMFSVVFQDVNTLAFTIEENVACHSEEIDEEKVQKVLEKVGLWNKVSGFEKGTKQMMLKIIDEDGTEFSGGEKQKLSIARALYENGNMVIMDEPTAALDALAEADIYNDFDSLVKGKTAMYISHRLASTKFCDRIMLFDRTGIAECGTHDELMALGGKYYEMFTIQGKYYQEENANECA